jgi:hypothetical protein
MREALMNLRKLTDLSLLEKTTELVQRERELLTEILHHLLEIERRRLFSQWSEPLKLDT